MKVRSITKKPLNTTNMPPGIIGRRPNTMRVVPTKRQVITLIWHTGTMCSLPNTLKKQQSITVSNTISTELRRAAFCWRS
jgi:hypothetical protein